MASRVRIIEFDEICSQVHLWKECLTRSSDRLRIWRGFQVWRAVLWLLVEFQLILISLGIFWSGNPWLEAGWGLIYACFTNPFLNAMLIFWLLLIFLALISKFVCIAFLFIISCLAGCDWRFVWSESNYPLTASLREIVDSIHSKISKVEDDLKVLLFAIASNRCVS